MRKSRIYSKTGLYHVVVRGVNKQNIFFDDDDRKFFLHLLKKFSQKYGIRIYAYCLMENHVHLEFEDPEFSISRFMQCVCSVYARFFNKKYDRIGHLFQDRYASEVIESDEYFLTVLRYILQNPEKAGVCKSYEYLWSSYRCYTYYRTFIKRKRIMIYFNCIKDFYSFINAYADAACLEIELRPSEKESDYITRVKKILESDNPIIKPDLSVELIKEKLRKLKKAGLSIRVISRITGIGKHLVQIA